MERAGKWLLPHACEVTGSTELCMRFLVPAFGFTERGFWQKYMCRFLKLCCHAVSLTPDPFPLENVSSLGWPCWAGPCNPYNPKVRSGPRPDTGSD